MTRILSSDMDGTIIFDHAISAADAAALQCWRDAGNLLVLNSGRSVTLTGRAVGLVRMDDGAPGPRIEYDYALCSSGTVLLCGDGSVLSADTFAPQVLREMLTPLDRWGEALVTAATTDGDFTLQDPLDTMNTNPMLVTDHFDHITVEDLLTNHQVTALTMHTPEAAEMDYLGERTLAEAGQIVDCIRSTGFLDVVMRGENKGTGLERLLARLEQQGVPVEETIAIGDSWNDIHMLEVADTPCAMAGAAAPVLAATGGRTTSSMAAFIDELLG